MVARKLEKTVFPERGWNETEWLLSVLCVQAETQDHHVASMVFEQKRGCTLFFTQPPHVGNNKNTRTQKISLPRLLRSEEQPTTSKSRRELESDLL